MRVCRTHGRFRFDMMDGASILPQNNMRFVYVFLFGRHCKGGAKNRSIIRHRKSNEKNGTRLLGASLFNAVSGSLNGLVFGSPFRIAYPQDVHRAFILSSDNPRPKYVLIVVVHTHILILYFNVLRSCMATCSIL